MTSVEDGDFACIGTFENMSERVTWKDKKVIENIWRSSGGGCENFG